MTVFDENIKERSYIDRREKHPPLFSKYLFMGRRAMPRRVEDRLRPQMVDRYSSRILAIIVLILALSILDAMFTLFLVGNGAEEVNPLLSYYLDRGPLNFLCVKYFLTCASVIIILSCKDCPIFNSKVKARVLFFLLPIPFILVIPWQLHLIFFGF